MIAPIQKTPSGTTPTMGQATNLTTPAFASAVGVGNLIVAVCSIFASAGAAANIVFSDSDGNTWYNDKNIVSGDGRNRLVIAHCYAKAAVAITVNANTGVTNYMDLSAEEYSGVLAGLTAGGSANNSATGTGTSPSPGQLTIAGNALYISGISWDASAACSVSGFTEVHEETGWTNANLNSAYLISSGNQTPTGTLGSSCEWVHAGVAFAEAGASPAPTVRLSTLSNGSGIISAQTVTGYTSGSITFTTVQGSVPYGNMFLTVTNNSGVISNGFPVFLTGNPTFPNKTVVIGGAGNRSGSHDDNAGFYNTGVTYATMQGVNGDPLYSAMNCIYDGNSGIIKKVSSFASGLAGNWVNIISGASGTLENKRYNILQSDSDWLLIGIGYTNNSNINVRVGGALRSYEKAFSSGILVSGDTFYSTYSGSYIMNNSGTITIQSTGTGNRPMIGGGMIALV